MNQKAIITAASNKFFPSLINLLGSLKVHFPNHPKIYVYDLGLFFTFRDELEGLENVEVLDIPHFKPFWRSCYTWKTYILSHPLAELNFYLDAGNQVFNPLDEIFDIIDRDAYFAVAQGSPLEDIVPSEYKSLFPIGEEFYKQKCITAGVFGFKAGSPVSKTLDKLYDAGQAGLALGYSLAESWRNRGVDTTYCVRDCKMFRHDTTLLSLLMRQDFKDFKIQDTQKYANPNPLAMVPGQLICNFRLNYSKLTFGPAFWFNRVMVKLMLLVKRILKSVKRVI